MDTERLTRYVMLKDHYNVTKNEVSFRAFLPPKTADDLSVMRTHSLSETEVWELGEQAGEGTRVVFARGDFVAPHVREVVVDEWRLNVVPYEPPVRHANIVGWAPTTALDKRKLLAQQLRAKATPLGYPNRTEAPPTTLT